MYVVYIFLVYLRSCYLFSHQARLLDCLQGCLHSKFERDEFGEACNLLVETMGKLGALPSLVNLSRVVKCLSDGSAAIKEIGITLINQLVNGYVRFRHTLNIGSDQFGVIAALVRIAQDKATGLVGRTWQCLMNIAKDRESIKGMLAAGVHSEALRHLAETYGDALLMRKQASGTYLYGFTLVTLMNMLQWPEARDAIKAAGAVDFFKTCFEHDSLMGLYCAVIMAFLVGNDESGNSAGLLQSSPSTLERIADCLANTTNRVGGDGYNYGIFSLGLIASAVQNVCINDSNKRYFATPRVLKILTQILDDFSSNKESGNVGGGGDDVESAQTSVEILLLLSFVFEDDAELRGFMSAETGVLAALRSFYQVIGEYKTSADAQQTCGLLLKRLTPPPVFLPFESSSTRAQASLATDDCVSQQLPSTVEEQVSAQPTHAKHIMVSYCWQDKPNVIKLCAALRGRGHDVWRDEDGSSVLEGMGGATQDRMAEAVELSSHVIVCVSRIYKERPNCRFEAQYANKLSLRKRLRIVYVMMDEEYSSEVDGWLGFMMSDELWYKCWSDEGIQQSADTLSNRVFGAMQQPTVAPPIAPVHAASLPEPVSRPCSSDASATAASSRSVPASNGGQLVSLSSPLGPAMQAASASTPLAAAPNLKMSFVSPSPSSSFSPCASGHVELTPMSHVAATGSTPTSASLRRVSPAQSWTNAQLTASSSVAAVHPLALQNLLDEVGCTWTEDADEPEAVRAGLAAAKRRAYRLSLAWEVLCHAFNARNASDVASRLCEWGLERPAHLAFLAAEDISLLAAMLKLVPRKMFLDLVSPHSQV